MPVASCRRRDSTGSADDNGRRRRTSIGAQGGLIGVASKSTATSLRVYNGHDKYNEWVFVAQQASGRIGAPNASQTPTGGINLPGGHPAHAAAAATSRLRQVPDEDPAIRHQVQALRAVAGQATQAPGHHSVKAASVAPAAAR